MKTLLLIDANSLIHRAFHALPPLTTPDGQASQALYGVSSILLKLWREEKPGYAAALFDRPEPTFRKEKYPKYKAQRPAAPDELISQIIEARQLFSKFGIRVFEKPGFEADDLIATLAEKFKAEPEAKITILTGDLDTLQLVEGDKIAVKTPRKGVSDTVIYNEKAVRERYGLEPSQLTDYKAFVGDASDNIKGVPGVGPKTAAELLKKYGTVEKIFDHLKNDPKLEERLGKWRETAELSKHLVTLDRQVPISLGSIDDLRVSEDSDELKNYFRTLGFGTLIKRFENGVVETSAKVKIQKTEKPTNSQTKLF